MFSDILPILLSIIIHESGHLLLFLLCGIRISGFTLKPGEMRIKAAGFLPYEKEFAISSGGPAANLLTAGIAMLFPPCAFADALIASSLCLAVLNLTPVSELDGGRILSSFCGILFTQKKQNKICAVADISGIITLWLVAVYFIIKTASGISLFFFALMLLARLFQSKET